MTTCHNATASAQRATPVVVRLLLLLLLPLLAALLYWRGEQYDPTLLDFKSGGGSRLATLVPEQVANWHRREGVRLFGKENLYEYINGHAEYFLSAGFRALVVAEYRLPTDTKQPSMVLDLYDMGEPLNAFGVLMDELGAGQSVVVGDMGVQTQRTLGFVSGPYYVKLAAFADGLPLLAAAQVVSQAIHATTNPALGQLSLHFLFPDLGSVLATRFIKENYHGWRFLQRVVERRFERADATVIQAFRVSGTHEQLAALEQAFMDFFQQEETTVTEIREEGMRILQMTDRYEGDWILLPIAGGWLGIFHPLDLPLKKQLKSFADHG